MQVPDSPRVWSPVESFDQVEVFTRVIWSVDLANVGRVWHNKCTSCRCSRDGFKLYKLRGSVKKFGLFHHSIPYSYP